MLDFKNNIRTQTQLSIVREEPSAMLPQDLFLNMLHLERRRSNRSGRSFVLMLLETGELLKAGVKPQIIPKLYRALTQSIRDTDLMGWYKAGAVVGVIFTELGGPADKAVVHALSSKVTDALFDNLTVTQINEIRLSFHVFPEDWEEEGPADPVTSTLQLALARELNRRKSFLHVKRFMDIVGSLAALILCLPLLVLIATAIKLTSKGPVFFRQVRMGQYGRKFTFLKFRSMHFGNDSTIHEEYVKRLIAGENGAEQTARNQQKQYKLTADPRITRIGRFLRRTSLDELPQFINVLRGEMSLVGPRPPIGYEVKCYDVWHKQRLLAVKPGITGLWQVEGRSRVKFDEMVRLDIRYARSWSLWLDIKILLQTPGAVIVGDGAC